MRCLKIAFITLLSLLLSLIIGVGLLTYNLDLIIRPQILEKAQNKWLPDLETDWSKIQIDVENKGWFQKELNILTDDLCISYKTSNFCHDALALSFQIKPFSKNPFVFLKLYLFGQKNQINLSDFSSESNEEQSYILMQKRIQNLKSSLNSLAPYFPLDFNIESKGVLKSSDSKSNYELVFNSSKIQVGYRQKNLKIKLTSKNDFDLKFDSLNQYVISFENESTVFKSDIKLNINSLSKAYIDLDADLSFKDSSQSYEFSTDLALTSLEDKSDLKIVVLSTSLKSYLNDLTLKGCSLSLSVDKAKNINFRCVDSSFLVSEQSFDTKWAKEQVQKVGAFIFDLKASIDERAFMTEDRSNFGSIDFTLKEKRADFFRVHGETKVELFKNLKSYSYEPKFFEAELEVTSFADFSRSIEETAFALPAPINQYNGSFKATARDLVKKEGVIDIPFEVLFNLYGEKKSKIDLSSNGSLRLSPIGKSQYKPSLKARVEVRDLSFYMPDFDPIQGMPKLTSDSRIVRSKKSTAVGAFTKGSDNEKKSTKTSFDYNIEIKTLSSQSIKLFYQHFEPFVPLGFEASLSPAKTKFKVVSKRDWKVDYVRREVIVEKITFQNRPEYPGEYDVDARLKYEASGYDIYIKILGEVASPEVSFRSDPPLSREDIISVLLYNRTAEDLDRFQSESIGGAESAFADRALGLVGIWAFASTPIESVSYDSRTKVYRAQVALPGGVKFDIGTDWERVQNLSLRKRLSKYWMVVTSYEPGTGENDNEGVGNVYIQREWIF